MVRATFIMKEIQLTQGQVALVDDEDFEILLQWKWCAQKKRLGSGFYAKRGTKVNRKSRNLFMHRYILNLQKGQMVDHRDGNGLNNQKSNLRLCTHSQNLCNAKRHKNNTSGFRGVSLDKRCQKWHAQINMNGVTHSLKYFSTPQEAAIAYNNAAKKYHGEFAVLNKIEG